MGKKNTKATKKSKEVLIDKKKVNYWPPVLLFLAGILILYPPLWQGLFFDKSMFVSHIITSTVFALVLVERIRQKDYVLLRTPLDWAILAYTAAYLLSLIGAVHQGEAICGFLKALNYFMVYWVVTQVARTYDQVRELLKFILAGGTAVALIGILAAAGYSNYPGAFVNGQIMSTLQYSNTMAAYLAVAVIIGVTLLQQEKNFAPKIIYSIAMYCMGLAILGSLSKGAWVILGGGALLLLIGMPGIYRLKSLYSLGLVLGSALVAYLPFREAISSPPPTGSLNHVGVGILLVIIGVLLWEVVALIWNKHRLAPLIITTVFSILLIVGTISAVTPAVQSGGIVSEINSLFNVEDSSYVSRISFMNWATEIALDNPIVGTGAGGWEALYRQYQDYHLWTTETHSHIFQVWVEAGTIGLLVYLSFWIILLFYLYRIYTSKGKEDKGLWILAWGIGSGCLALGAHAAIDFDLSIPAMCMVLWGLSGLLNSLYNDICHISSSSLTARYPAAKFAQVGVAGLLVAILLVSGSRYLYAYNQAVQGGDALRQWNQQSGKQQLLTEAAQHYTNAVRNDPHNGIYWVDLATLQVSVYNILEQQQHPQAAIYRQQGIDMMKKAAELRPYDPELLSILLKNAASIGDLEGIKTYGKMVPDTVPNDPRSYELVAQIWWEASQMCWHNNQSDMAFDFATLIISMHQDLSQQLKQVNVEHPLWQGEKLQVTEEFDKVYREAERFLAENKQL